MVSIFSHMHRTKCSWLLGVASHGSFVIPAVEDGPDTFLGRCPMIVPSFFTATAYRFAVFLGSHWHARISLTATFQISLFSVVDANTASSFDSTIFHAFLTCMFHSGLWAWERGDRSFRIDVQ